MPKKITYYCEKCKKILSEDNFYQYKDGTKCELCKACLTMHVDNYDESTFLWLLEKFDIPYLPWEWNALRDRAYQKNPYKMNGMSVFGIYLSKSKLKQYINPETGQYYGYADSERLQREYQLKMEEMGAPNQRAEKRLEEMEQAYIRGEISEAQWETYKKLNSPAAAAISPAVALSTPPPGLPANFAATPFEAVVMPDVAGNLTAEDKVYLAVKWGQLYSPSDWVYLEQKYKDFTDSFDIQGAAREDNLIQICKLSLKLNQALDTGDYDTYAKLSRAYDAIMKAARFTEAQNKEVSANDFDSIGSLIAFCEREGGFIPEHVVEAPQDVVDTIIEDNRTYLRELIDKDSNLSQQIETFLRKRENLEQIEKKEGKNIEFGDDIEPIGEEE